ncbi:MAG: cytochrome c biogenesis protein ResB [Puniceicoccaceae bacterium]
MHILPFFKRLLKELGSLRLSVFLLGFSVLLVFFGTLDQVRIGIRQAQDIYFESFIAIWRYPEFWPGGNFLRFIPVVLPGGYLIGPLLALNLVLAHARYWRPRWSIMGISFIHVGILMLLVGQLVTNIFQEEDYMWLDEGGKANFIRSFHEDEFYLTKQKEDGRLGVFSYDFKDLAKGAVLEPEIPGQPGLFPLQVRVREVFNNAEINQGGAVMGRETYGITRGIGAQFNLGVKAIGSFNSDERRDIRTAVVDVLSEGEVVGTWLVSNVFEERFPEQEFMIDGQTYQIGLRFKKTYLPYTITLLEFNHDRYPGTNIPSNFSSRVRVEHAVNGDEKEVMIFMNNPLRYEGRTYYQASFAKQDTASMFQVVKNPGWLVPYIACILVSIGLCWQFTVAGYRMTRRMK